MPVRTLAALALAAFATAAAPALAQSGGGGGADAPLTRGDVEGIVRDYLIANPEVLQEAFNALQTKRTAEAATARAAAIESNRAALETSPLGPVLGNPDGDVTLVEFFDYNCSYCRHALGDLNDLIAADPNLRVVLREFPVLGEGSMKAAAVSIAVHEVAPERYEEFHNALLSNQGHADEAVALQTVDSLKIPRAAVEAAMRSDSVRKSVEESYRLGQALKLDGTPSYIVGDAVEEGAVGVAALKQRINEARCGKADC
jgi:protein-disulfide isomerase